MEINIGQGILAAAVLIGEVYMVEVDAAVGHVKHGLFRLFQIGRFVQALR